MGLEAEGDTLDEALCAAAEGMFNLMFELSGVQPQHTVGVECEAGDEAALCVEWLNELLAQRDITGMVFSQFRITALEECGVGEARTLLLHGQASGEPFDAARHATRLEVKAATYFGLRYERSDGRHILRCVLDV